MHLYQKELFLPDVKSAGISGVAAVPAFTAPVRKQRYTGSGWDRVKINIPPDKQMAFALATTPYPLHKRSSPRFQGLSFSSASLLCFRFLPSKAWGALFVCFEPFFLSLGSHLHL